MSLNSIILQALTPLNVPVRFQTYQGTATTYITFFEYNQRSAVDADDNEINTSHSIQVDIWSKGDYTTLVVQVKQRLKEQGFRRITEAELYETDSQTYHKAIRFNYVQ